MGGVGGFSSVYSDHGFYGNDYSGGNLFPKYQQQEQQQPLILDYGLYDAMQFDPLSLPFQGCLEEITKLKDIPNLVPHVEPKKGKQDCFSSLAGLDLLNNYGSGFKSTGNPVERVVHFFSEALREKIDRETGRVTLTGLGNKQSFDVDRAMKNLNVTSFAFQIKIPFGQVVQFAGIQAIVENVAESKKVHVIDLEIQNGVQWAGLMQALASRCDCRLELLKITAIGTNCRESIEATCKRLRSFAKTMNLPFSFKIVMVQDMLDLKEDMFELDSEETVAVYSGLALRSMVPKLDRLESVIRVIKNICPCVTVVTEVEANHNLPVFVTRFIEALFFFAAFFDCVEACIHQDDPNRSTLESMYFGNGIRSMVSIEGEERNTRHVKIDVWRAFFVQYGMKEIELSSSSLYQADLVLKKFSCGSSCTLNMDGKCLLVGWKGTHLLSLSLWKFL